MTHTVIRVELVNAGLHDYRLDHAVTPDLDPLEPVPLAADGGFSLAFGLQAATLPGYSLSPDSHHRVTVSFSVPDSDMPRVIGWFTGHYDNVTQPASDTLLRNVSDAVDDVLKAYFAAAATRNIFTGPFRIGWAFRYSDGSRRMTQPMTLMQPNTHSPVMAVDSYSFPSGGASSVTDIINRPCRLTCRPSGVITDADVTHIDIIGAPPASLMPLPLRCTGLYTAVEEGTRCRAYRYNALDDTAVLGNASLQNDLRILASIPVADLNPEAEATVPVLDGALANWKLLDKFTTGGGGGGDDPDTPDDPEDPDPWEPYIDKITDPLDLGDPEGRKWLRRVMVRGTFDRSALRIRVYGSRHRQSWRLIADGTRGWATALVAACYRWFRVRLTANLRRSDRLTALSFRLTRH